MDPVNRIARKAVELATTALRLDTTVVTSANPLLVQGADGDVQLSALGWYRPSVGDTVSVLRAGQKALILGATTPNQLAVPPMEGTVTAAPGTGATSVSVLCDGRTYLLPWLASYTPVANDSVRILWHQVDSAAYSGLVLGKAGSVAAATSKPPVEKEVPPPAQSNPVGDAGKVVVVSAYDGATWRGSGWRTDTGSTLYSGDWTGRGQNRAYFFYGGRFGGVQGTVKSARILLYAGGGGPSGASANPMVLHGAKARGATEPTRFEAFAGPALADNSFGWASIPANLAQMLVDRTREGVAVIGAGTAQYTALQPIGALAATTVNGRSTRVGVQGDIEITLA